MPTQHWDQAQASTEQPCASFVDEHGCIAHRGCQPSSRARSFVCSCTCIKMYAKKKEALACRRAARSMVTRSLLFIVRLCFSPETGTININRNIRVQNNHASHSYTSITVASTIGDASQVCFPRRFFFLASTPDGGVRVGT